MPAVPGQEPNPQLFVLETHYRDLLRSLMPRGPYWERVLGDSWTNLLWGLSGIFFRLNVRINQLLIEADPRTADEMLAAWEEMAGLPDPCSGAPATVGERRQVLHARITAQGGQSPEYFEGVAANLGLDVEVTSRPYSVFRVSVNRMGDRLYGTGWHFVWRVTVDGAGPDAQLECLFAKLKPAHTIIEFVYSGG
jgi:uncharacterized protein YmfQ (DUF2313 family)